MLGELRSGMMACPSEREGQGRGMCGIRARFAWSWGKKTHVKAWGTESLGDVGCERKGESVGKWEGHRGSSVARGGCEGSGWGGKGRRCREMKRAQWERTSD